MAPVSITYDLGEYGWSFLELNVGDAKVEIGNFGCIPDSWGDLVRAALVMATSGYEAKVLFEAEPGGWRLVIDEGWLKDARLRVFLVRDHMDATEIGELIFQARVKADDFARAVLSVARSIWEQYGAAGYNKAWTGMQGFPLRAMRALELALSIDEPESYRDSRPPDQNP